MATTLEIREYLTEVIKSELLLKDPIYLELTEQGTIDKIIENAASSIGCTVTNLSDEEKSYVILLAQKQIYLTLATSSAHDYDIETQFTKLLKSDRFNHYMKLVSIIDSTIKRKENAGAFTVVKKGEVIINGAKNSTERNYAFANKQIIELSISNITSTSFDMDWSQFDPNLSVFRCYKVFIGTTGMYDEYELEKIDQTKVIKSYVLTDIKRTKFRVKNLSPVTSYVVLLCYDATNGNEDVYTTNVTTLGA